VNFQLADTEVTQNSEVSIVVQAPYVTKWDEAVVVGNEFDIIPATGIAQAIEKKMRGYDATNTDMAFYGVCHNAPSQVNFAEKGADEFYFKHHKCGNTKSAPDWIVMPDDVSPSTTSADVANNCRHEYRVFKFTTTIADLVGLNTDVGSHQHVKMRKNGIKSVSYQWMLVTMETVVDEEGLENTNTVEHPLEVEILTTGEISLRSQGAQRAPAVSELERIDSKSLSSALSTHLEVTATLCISEPIQTTDSFETFTLVNPIGGRSKVDRSRVIFHPEADTLMKALPAKLSQNNVPGYHIDMRYLSSSSSDDNFDAAPIVSCPIIEQTFVESVLGTDQKMTTANGDYLGNANWRYHCYARIYSCAVPIYESDELRLQLRMPYLVKSGGHYVTSPIETKASAITHETNVVITGSVVQSATRSFSVGARLRRIGLTQRDENLLEKRHSVDSSSVGISQNTYIETQRLLYGEPFLDNKQKFYTNGALGRLFTNTPFAFEVFPQHLEDRQKYVLAPTCVIAYLREISANGHQDFSAAENSATSYGETISEPREDYCSILSEAEMNFDSSKISRGIVLSCPAIYQSESEKTEEIDRFYNPYLRSLYDQVRENVFDIKLLRYLQTSNLWVTKNQNKEFFWNKDYRGGLHSGSGANLFTLFHGLRLDDVEDNTRFELKTCYCGAILPRAEMGPLKSDAATLESLNLPISKSLRGYAHRHLLQENQTARSIRHEFTTSLSSHQLRNLLSNKQDSTHSNDEYEQSSLLIERQAELVPYLERDYVEMFATKRANNGSTNTTTPPPTMSPTTSTPTMSPNTSGTPSLSPTITHTPSPTSSASFKDDDDDDNSVKRKETIAVIVLGCVAGVALLGATGYFVYRYFTMYRKNGKHDLLLSKPSSRSDGSHISSGRASILKRKPKSASLKF